MPFPAISVPDPSCVLSPDLKQQMVAALMNVPRAPQEKAGILYKTEDGQYCWTLPVTTSQDRFDIKAKMPPNATLAGIYHTHSVDGTKGVNKLDAQFSPEDVHVADQLKVPSYIKVLRNDRILGYTPGVTESQGKGGNKSSLGDDVDASYIKLIAAALSKP